jgi:hypothetical protein
MKILGGAYFVWGHTIRAMIQNDTPSRRAGVGNFDTFVTLEWMPSAKVL